MMSARSDSQSTILPLPSSPHWAPITTTLAISTTPGESLPSMLAVNSRWHGAGARYRRAVEQNFKLSQGGAGRVSRGELQQRAHVWCSTRCAWISQVRVSGSFCGADRNRAWSSAAREGCRSDKGSWLQPLAGLPPPAGRPHGIWLLGLGLGAIGSQFPERWAMKSREGWFGRGFGANSGLVAPATGVLCACLARDT